MQAKKIDFSFVPANFFTLFASSNSQKLAWGMERNYAPLQQRNAYRQCSSCIDSAPKVRFHSYLENELSLS